LASAADELREHSGQTSQDETSPKATVVRFGFTA